MPKWSTNESATHEAGALEVGITIGCDDPLVAKRLLTRLLVVARMAGRMLEPAQEVANPCGCCGEAAADMEARGEL